MCELLSSQGLSNIDWDMEDHDFTFFVGERQYICNHIQAMFLMPKLKLMKVSDSTLCSYIIENGECYDSFEAVFQIIQGKALEFTKEIQYQILDLAFEFNNIELAKMVMPSDNLTISTVFDLVDMKSHIDLDIINECEFIAENFYKIQASQLYNLSIQVMNVVLNSKNLTVLSEDSLFEFLIDYVKIHPNASHLFGCIYFQCLDIDHLQIYLSIIEKYQIFEIIWPNLSHHLLLKDKPSQFKHKRCSDYDWIPLDPSILTRIYNDNDDYFSGIIREISDNFRTDIVNDGIIDITASGVGSGDINHVIQNNDTKWRSNNTKYSWIQFDFKSKSILLKSYSIRSFSGPKSWKVEGSNDMKVFTLIDHRNNPNDFKPNQHTNKHYYVNGSQDWFRYIRITQCDEGDYSMGWGNIRNLTYQFSLTRVEFYGSLCPRDPNHE